MEWDKQLTLAAAVRWDPDLYSASLLGMAAVKLRLNFSVITSVVAKEVI